MNFFVKNTELSVLMRILGLMLLVCSNMASAVEIASYLPLAPGSQWSYANGSYGTRSTTVGSPVSLPSGVSAIPQTIVDSSKTGSTTTYVTLDSNGYRLHQQNISSVYVTGYGNTSATAVYSPALRYAPATVDIGASYSSSGSVAITYKNVQTVNLSYTQTSNVVGFEKVSNKAGTQSWDAVKINTSITLSGTINGSFYTDTESETVWLVNGLGTVQSYFPNDAKVMETWKLTTTNVTIPTTALPTTTTTTKTSTSTTGSVPTTTQALASTSLVTGWNLMGNSSNTNWDVSTVFGDKTKITTVWKWMADSSRWAFYAPSMSVSALLDYANAKGYDVLTTVGPGDGVWVNTQLATTVIASTGTAMTSGNFQTYPQGWSLIATGDNLTPRRFNAALSDTPPSTNAIPNNVVSLWAWDAALAKWYFYAPSIDATNELATYTTSKGYLDFGVKTLTAGIGFWINKATASSGVSAQKQVDGYWYGTYFHKPSNTTYSLCQNKGGDMLVTADGWMTVFVRSDTSCQSDSLVGYMRVPYRVDSSGNIFILQGGTTIQLDANENLIGIVNLPSGTGTVINGTSNNRTMSLNFSDGSTLSVALDQTNMQPKQVVIENFNKTQGQYLGRIGSDVEGTNFTITADGSISGVLSLLPWVDLSGDVHTCSIQNGANALQPGNAGYYLIKTIGLTCTKRSDGSSYKKSVNGYATPYLQNNAAYGARASIVGANNAASIFLSLFDVSEFTRPVVIVSDNLVLQ
jgi:hypothetical protein